MAELYTATARRLLSLIALRVTLDGGPETESLEVLRVLLRGDGWEHVTLLPGDFPAASITAELARHGYITRPPEPADGYENLPSGTTSGDWRYVAGPRLWMAPVEPYDGRPRRGIVTLPPGSVLPPS